MDVAALRARFGEQTAGRRPDRWVEAVEACLNDLAFELGEAQMPAESYADAIYEHGIGLKAARRGVTLATVHAAKGLEFEHVLVLDGGWARRTGKLEAERRLLYVALTRARATLALARLSPRPALLTPLIDDPAILLREDLPQPPDPALSRRWQSLTLADVDIDFAGRHPAAHPVHAALAALQPGDPLCLEGRALQTPEGVQVGRLAQRFQPDPGQVRGVRATAIVRRNIEQVKEEQWRQSLRVPVWETPIAELEYL